MENKNPIIIIDDDNEDLDLINEAFAQLNVSNEIIYFNDGYKFIDYIRETDSKSFFILCDINMSKITGLELKKIIYQDEQLRPKCIPFIFHSTSGASDSIMTAYSYGVQGYFIKPDSIEGIKEMLNYIIKYWENSQHPRQ